MTAHKHAEMIKAKADNMELVVFAKSPTSSRWCKTSPESLPLFNEFKEYFLCHPKHERECFHWLNRGSSQFKDDSMRDWDTVGQRRAWNKHSPFMSEDFDFRIKPRKEKRWIVVKNETLLSNRLFESESEAAVVCGRESNGAQFIQIEVEI